MIILYILDKHTQARSTNQGARLTGDWGARSKPEHAVTQTYHPTYHPMCDCIQKHHWVTDLL